MPAGLSAKWPALVAAEAAASTAAVAVEQGVGRPPLGWAAAPPLSMRSVTISPIETFGRQSGVVSPTAITGVPSAERLDEPTPPRVAAMVPSAVVSPRVVATPRAEAARRSPRRPHSVQENRSPRTFPTTGLLVGGGGSADRAIGAATVSPRPALASRAATRPTSRVQTPRDKNSFRRSRRAAARATGVGALVDNAVSPSLPALQATRQAEDIRRLYGVNRA